MKYKVISPLNHDNTVHSVGSTLELPEETGSGLVKIGVLSTIVDSDHETASGAEAAQGSGEAQEEAPQAPKKTSKRKVEADDE